MLSLKGMPEEKFFLLPDYRGGKEIFIKKCHHGREEVYVVRAAEAKDEHRIRAKRLYGADRPHFAAKAALVPIETFFITTPEVVYED